MNATDKPSDEEVRLVLSKVVSSPGFNTSPRLCEFLNYVVEEALAGRADAIRAKTIALDVYERLPDNEDLAANMVRVDAGRLRRLLATYNNAYGTSDPITIEVPKGAYIPRFTRAATQQSAVEPEKPPTSKVSILLLAICLVVAGLSAVYLLPRAVTEQSPTEDELSAAERQAAFEASPARLQSANLTAQGRELIFPAFDTARVLAARALFDRAIELDPSNAQAHAGDAIVNSMIGFLSPPGPGAEASKDAGIKHADAAIEIAPETGWAQISKAWALFVAGYENEAKERAELAIRLAPYDDTVQDYQALIHLFSGDFATAARLCDPEFDGLPYGKRSPRLNALGTARFQLGDFDGAIDAFNASANQGAPVSALATGFLVASYQAAGRQDEAERLAAELQASWPDSKLVALARRMFSSTTDLNGFSNALEAAGLETTKLN